MPPKPSELSARSCLHKKKVGFWWAVAHFHAIYIITYFSVETSFGGAIWSCHHMCRFMYYRELEKKKKSWQSMTGKKPITNSDWQETNLSVACQLKKCFTTTSCTILQGTQQIILPVSHYSCWMMGHISPQTLLTGQFTKMLFFMYDHHTSKYHILLVSM